MDNATEVMYSDGTMAFVTVNSSGQYRVHITALNCAGSSPALSGVINIINTGIHVHIRKQGVGKGAGSHPPRFLAYIIENRSGVK